MGGLIPLLLPSTAGNRASVIYNPVEAIRPATAMAQTTTTKQAHRRQQSLPTPNPTRRLSISVAPPALPLLPYTADEWKKAVNEVKRKFVNHKYRTCSARCCEILDNLKDISNVEPLHLVYLHFYAASSFEMCARPLSQSSAYRTKLLRDAKHHYETADNLILKVQETTTVQETRSFSPSNSMTSSMHSPSLSSSSASTVSTALSSPRTSVFSPGDKTEIVAKPAKKKVSFSGLPEPIEIPKPWQNWSEPYIRPDSPTLGWEEDYFLFGSQGSPAPVVPAPGPEPAVIEEEPVPQEEPETETPKVPLAAGVSSPRPDEAKFDLEAFLQTKNMIRFCAQLSALRNQVFWHRDAVNGLLAEHDDTPETPAVPELPQDLARIERLRASGWQRKRFDSRRYEVLREQVLNELGA
ncbi:uncharacterized protein BCR38DRAFT_465177 [Pseudomassariella vexata]|uniref:Uncharacterized protein n=1 Tax=Pseudomassariella vexata TaxID=1141098 RepID=A0A1Y2E3U7_9PEZI|nr:uncharacterized protein BCR38DRAFT_465177 [Pseudomassariella vexata]ORY66230.1 hypothetical protein BCR38DRAFT_465177 [Pseudomassariella vexata]